MNISGEDIICLIICIIGAASSIKWLECVCKYCFNAKYRQTAQKNIHAKVLHEFMCIFIGAPIMVGISSIIIMIRIFAGTL